MAYSLIYFYDSTSESYTVTGYSNITASDEVVIPDTYDNGTNGEHPVTSVGDSAFRGCSSLTSVTIGSNVTSISSRAFCNCDILVSVTIPSSVTNIGSSAFDGCYRLTNIIIPDNVTIISAYAFYGCTRLTQLILFPSTPPGLGSYAIPNNVQSIYVQQSSKSAYQAATNWKAFATESNNKIVSDNIYLSFVRFNESNKEYIAKKITAEASNVIPNIMSEQPLGFRRLVGQSRKTIDDTRKTSIYTIASENAAIIPDRIPWYRAPGNPDNIAEQPTATLPVSDPAWEFDAVNKRYADSKVDNDTDRIRCGDLYVAGAMGLIQAKQIQNPSRGNGVTVNDKLKVLIAPTKSDDVLRWQEKVELETKINKINTFINTIFTDTTSVHFTESGSFGTGLWFSAAGIYRVKATYTYGSESGTDILIFSVSETYNSSNYSHNYEIKVLKNGNRVIAASDRQGSGNLTEGQMQWIWFYSGTSGVTNVTNWKYEELNLADLGTIS